MISKEELVEALRGLNAEQLSGILSQGYGRSPLRPRQLNDLRLLPTATDPRPLFMPSVEAPRDQIITHLPYPKLLWHGKTKEEITVHSAEEEAAKVSKGYVTVAPESVPLDPEEQLKAMFDALSPEDQALILEHQRSQARQKVQALMGGMNDSQIGSALGVETPRKPGRPRKDASA